MERQVDKILNEDWDVLCVLDACRYDKFNKIWSAEKVWSPGSYTYEFCMNVFQGYSKKFKDVVVISANPYLNSYGLSDAEFKPENKFKKIYNIWEKTNKEGITLPEYLIDKFEEIKREYDKDQRFILWFIQPHFPYLNYTCCLDKNPRNKTLKGLGKKSLSNWKKILVKMENYLPFFICRILWKFWDKFLGSNGMRRIFANHGKGSVLKGYMYSLIYTMEKIKSTNFGDRKVVVTADHGELITWEERKKHGNLSHPSNSEINLLREVPWYRL